MLKLGSMRFSSIQKQLKNDNLKQGSQLKKIQDNGQTQKSEKTPIFDDHGHIVGYTYVDKNGNTLEERLVSGNKGKHQYFDAHGNLMGEGVEAPDSRSTVVDDLPRGFDATSEYLDEHGNLVGEGVEHPDSRSTVVDDLPKGADATSDPLGKEASEPVKNDNEGNDNGASSASSLSSLGPISKRFMNLFKK